MRPFKDKIFRKDKNRGTNRILSTLHSPEHSAPYSSQEINDARVVAERNMWLQGGFHR